MRQEYFRPLPVPDHKTILAFELAFEESARAKRIFSIINKLHVKGNDTQISLFCDDNYSNANLFVNLQTFHGMSVASLVILKQNFRLLI